MLIALAYLVLIASAPIPPASAQSCRICGDTNGDGVVNIGDALLIAQLSVGLRDEVPCPLRADLNSSGGGSDMVDAMYIGQFTVGARPLLCVQIDEPQPLELFSSPEATVTGSVVGIGQLRCNRRPIETTGQQFNTLLALAEGRNLISCYLADTSGNFVSAERVVMVDTIPPIVSIEAPGKGAVLTSLQTDVVGFVNDLMPGTTINADDCHVFVNGVEAAVMNRSYMVENLLLQPGLNTLRVEAVDRAGNRGSASIDVTVRDQAGQRLVLLSGNNQHAEAHAQIPEPLVVSAVNANGDPVPGVTVNFEVSRGDGKVSLPPETEATRVTTTTDDNGLARVLFTLGGRSGEGNNRVKATASGFLGEVGFCAIASPKPPSRIVVVTGENQNGVVGEPLPLPLAALVTDDMGNPVADIDVTFEVVEGGGRIAGRSEFKLTTDLDGIVETTFVLGPDEGINNNIVNARFEGLTANPATFVASGMLSGDPADTTVSGIVLDNSDIALPGVSIFVLGAPASATTDEQGRFTIKDAPVGSVHLIVDGSTTTRAGEYPHLAFELVTIAGQDNTIGRPIYLPLLDTAQAKMIGGPEDVVLHMTGLPGAELTVFANSVTCPDASSQCEAVWTRVNQERVPMPPPRGTAGLFDAALQPPGIQFSPPARVCFPNVGLETGAQVEIAAFDHDLGEYVGIGTATALSHSPRVCTDDGFGLVKSGWHLEERSQEPGCAVAKCVDPDPDDCLLPIRTSKCGPCRDEKLTRPRRCKLPGQADTRGLCLLGTCTCPTPSDLRQVFPTTNSDGANDGTLHFQYEYRASTGVLDDLLGCWIGERLNFPGSTPEFAPPMPMSFANGGKLPNPLINRALHMADKPAVVCGTNCGRFRDTLLPVRIVPPLINASYTTRQEYIYACDCEQFQQKSFGTFSITRSVIQDQNGNFRYQVQSRGIQESFPLSGP
jgi:hypothetical protein